MTLTGEDVLFVGLGKSVPCWYRCALPAFHLGCRWIGYSDRPPRGAVACGNTMETSLSVGSARVFVLQQPRGREWEFWMRHAKRAGAKVLYEVDDYLHGVRRLANPQGESIPVTQAIRDEYRRCMELSDGLICSTPYIAERYGGLNRTWVCRNGIDTARFGRERNQLRSRPSLGWFGGGSHDESLEEWAPVVSDFCNQEGLRFYSVGHQYGCWFGIERLTRVPFVGLENVPDALANIDIGLAPWHDSPFYAGKSDLRWLEGAAAGCAMIVDPRGYPDAAHGITAMHASDRHELIVNLIDLTTNDEARRHMASEARRYVESHRDASVTCEDWVAVFNDIAEEA